MPRGIYSTRFFAGQLNVGQGFTRAFTVPIGKVAIIRQFTFDVLSGPAGVQLGITMLPGSINATLGRWQTQAVGTVLQWETRVVVNEGELITIQNTTAGTTSVACQCSGYLLTA